MGISEIKYNRVLMKNKIRLEKELKMINKELSDSRKECQHIKVCLGFDGEYQYRDNSYSCCLKCGSENLSYYHTIQPIINATYYKTSEYGNGNTEESRERKFEELQNLFISYAEKFPDLTEQDIISKINEEIEMNVKENNVKEKKLRIKSI